MKKLVQIKCFYCKIIYWVFDLTPPLVHNMRMSLRYLATFMAQKFLNASQFGPFSNKCVANECRRVCTVAS